MDLFTRHWTISLQCVCMHARIHVRECENCETAGNITSIEEISFLTTSFAFRFSLMRRSTRFPRKWPAKMVHGKGAEKIC